MPLNISPSGSAPHSPQPVARVYAVSGNNTNLLYVGATLDEQRRAREQFTALEGERHYNNNLQNLFYCLGREQLSFIVLESASTASELAEKEQECINRLKETHELLNINFIVPRVHPGGHKLSDETRQRQSEAKKGDKHPAFGKTIPIEKTRARKYRFQSPTGEILETFGLKAFAEEHGLSVSTLSKLNRGIVMNHRGYTRVQTQ